MDYKVLYRKYRPSSFDDLVGQNYIVETLKNSIKNNLLSHAYIFSGPRGTGKTSTARIFSKAINCENNVEGKACGVCDNCKFFNENPDIIEIDAASHNGVDNIRDLIESIKLVPVKSKYKIYIIDEVHMMTQQAFNALLLTLEEPPKHVIFIFATTNVENIPTTIMSRCQRYNFRKLTNNEIKEKLEYVIKNENIKIEEEALNEIVSLSDGGLRDALSILDQLSKNNELITYQRIASEFSIVSNNEIMNIIDNIASGKIDDFINQVDKISLNNYDYKTFVKKYIVYATEFIEKNIKNNNYINNLYVITDSFEDIINSLKIINVSIDSYSLFKVMILKRFNIDNKSIIVSNQNKNENSDKEIIGLDNKDEMIKDNDSFKDVSDNIDNDFIDIRINNCFVFANKNELKENTILFDEFKNDDKIKANYRMMLQDATPVASSINYLIISCDNEHLAENLNSEITNLENICKKKYNKDIKMVFITEKRWLMEKEKYISNIKKGYKYKIIEEKENAEEINQLFSEHQIEIV